MEKFVERFRNCTRIIDVRRFTVPAFAYICVQFAYMICLSLVGVDKKKRTVNEFDQISVILSCGELSNFSVTQERKVNFANSAFIEIRARPPARSIKFQ